MRVVAYFDSADQLERAGRDAERAGWRVLSACSPAFSDKVVETAHATRSPVAAAALVGGVLGIGSGFALTIGTVREWPELIVGGKPLVSMPPFLIIVFELAILVASIAAVATFLIASARARRRAREAWDPSTTDDRFSLLLDSVSSPVNTIDDSLRRLRATAWRRV
jgi:Protein of unknown function (DUF3341)